MKARFLQQQPPLDVRRLDGRVWCYICVNGVQTTESVPGEDGAEHTETVWEYDYNEIVLESSESELLSKIEANPKAYVDYTPETEPTGTDALVQALTARIAALEAAAEQQAQVNAALTALGVDTTPDQITALRMLGVETEE